MMPSLKQFPPVPRPRRRARLPKCVRLAELYKLTASKNSGAFVSLPRFVPGIARPYTRLLSIPRPTSDFAR